MRNISAGQVSFLVPPQTALATAEVTASEDMRGFDYATVIVNFASEKNTNGIGPGISLLTSDDTVVTNFATITADRATEDIIAASGVLYHVDMRGLKRYLKLIVTPATTTNDNIVFGATIVKTRAEKSAASTTDMVASTNDAAVVV